MRERNGIVDLVASPTDRDDPERPLRAGPHNSDVCWKESRDYIVMAFSTGSLHKRRTKGPTTKRWGIRQRQMFECTRRGMVRERSGKKSREKRGSCRIHLPSTVHAFSDMVSLEVSPPVCSQSSEHIPKQQILFSKTR